VAHSYSLGFPFRRVRKIVQSIFSINFSPENGTVYETMWEKYSTARQATDDNIIQRMRFVCWKTKTTDTYAYAHGICNTATMVTRTHLNVTLQVHCLCRSLGPFPNPSFTVMTRKITPFVIQFYIDLIFLSVNIPTLNFTAKCAQGVSESR
jgi:hypothetical protein